VEIRDVDFSGLGTEQLMEATKLLYLAGSYSPTFVAERDAMPGIEVVAEDADASRREARRLAVVASPSSSTVSKESAAMSVSEKVVDVVTVDIYRHVTEHWRHPSDGQWARVVQKPDSPSKHRSRHRRFSGQTNTDRGSRGTSIECIR
jgi:hypothetical protein